MLGLGKFNKKPAIADELDTETLQSVFELVDNSAIPLSGNTLYRLAKLTATEIDEYLQRLVAQDKLEIAYEKSGLDGVSRAYYRTSAKYNLLDARDKVSEFIKSVVKKAKPLVDNGHHYHVKVPAHKQFNMPFTVRQDARDYKRLLKSSRMQLDAEIWEQAFEDGLQTEERKVS